MAEVELIFEGSQGTRKLILSGLSKERIPQLSPDNYGDGLYLPLGFGTPFTQEYENLKQLEPTESPLLSVVLDGENRTVDYRRDIGLNGVVLHRDAINSNLLHVYPMSYERITLVGHYVVDLEKI